MFFLREKNQAALSGGLVVDSVLGPGEKGAGKQRPRILEAAQGPVNRNVALQEPAETRFPAVGGRTIKYGGFFG
jgi:hypothetical protein